MSNERLAKVPGVRGVYRDVVNGDVVVRLVIPELGIDRQERLPHLTVHEAAELREEMLAALRAGEYDAREYQPATRTPTLAEWWSEQQRIAADPELGGLADKTIRHRWELAYWLDELGDEDVATLSPFRIRRWWHRFCREADMAPSTKNRSLQYLQRALEDAREFGLRDNNPARALRRMKREPRETSEQIGEDVVVDVICYLADYDEDLADARKTSHAYWRGHHVFFAVMVDLSCRQGDLIGLRWRDVTGSDIRLQIKGGDILRRPISAWTCERLELHRRRLDIDGLPCMTTGPGDYVFPNRNGDRSSRSTRKKAWAKAMEALGHPVGKDAGGWTPHQLRSYAITGVRTLGAPTWLSRGLSGHRSERTHEDYTVAQRRELAAAAERWAGSWIQAGRVESVRERA